MKKTSILFAAASLSLLSACGIGGSDAPSATQISATMDSGDLGKARRMIALALEDGVDNGDIRMLSAKLALSRGDGIGAETNIKAAKKHGIDDAAALPLMAEAYARQGKHEEALVAANKTDDETVIAHIAGLKYWADNKPWEAREALELAYKNAPNNTRLALDVARARNELGLFPEAREAIAAVRKAQPQNMLAPLLLGTVEMRARKFSAANKAYDEALEIAADSSDALLGQARALYSSGDYVGAEKSIIALPKDVAMREEIQLLAAKVSVQKKDYKAARLHFSNARNLVENDAEAQFLLGSMHIQNGQPYKAIQLLESAVSVRPDLPEYHAAIITAYLATDDKHSASRRLAKVPTSLKGAKELQGF